MEEEFTSVSGLSYMVMVDNEKFRTYLWQMYI